MHIIQKRLQMQQNPMQAPEKKQKKKGLRKSKGAALVFRSEIPGDMSKLSPHPKKISGLEEGAEE